MLILLVSNSINVLNKGNYYGLRGQHENAVLYFRRALRLNPNYLSAWTLMGHSYVELKNAAAAREAYRKAVGRNNSRLNKNLYCTVHEFKLLKMLFYMGCFIF